MYISGMVLYVNSMRKKFYHYDVEFENFLEKEDYRLTVGRGREHLWHIYLIVAMETRAVLTMRN